MNFSQKIDILISQNKPIPITQCQGCMGTIFRVGGWFQCPDCGGKTTGYGGYFPFMSMDGEKYRDDEYKNQCEESLLFLKS